MFISTEWIGNTTKYGKNGFKNVSTEYITINLTPDNPIYSRETAYAMINANRQVNIDNINGLSYIAPNIVDESEIEELKRLVNKNMIID